MIHRAFVSGYKSLNNVELELKPLTIIIGPNAGGKSNFFDALKLLSRLVTSRSLAEAFSDHRGDPLEAFDYSEDGIQGLLRKEQVQFTIEVDVELSKPVIDYVERLIETYRTKNEGKNKKPRRVTERFLRYRITVEMIPQTGVLRVVDESLRALKRQNGKFVPSKGRRPFLEKVENRLRLRMEGQARPTEYEVGLNYSIVSQPVYPPHYPHLVAFREELSRWRFYYFEPRLMREENPVKETLSLTSYGGDLAAFYHTLKHKNKRQFENLGKALKTLIPSISDLSVELTEEGKVRLKVREGHIYFTAKVISEGTLRLLGLMAILNPASPATVVGLEEPENGVQPRRLKLIADMLKNTSEYKQIIVNTHSPILPDYLSDAHLIQCIKENGHSVFKPLTVSPEGFASAEAPEESPILASQRILRGDWG